MDQRLKVLKRVGLSLLIGLLFGFVLNEITFQFVKESNRAPMEVRLTIPEGAADGGEELELPEEMTFVVGDVLVVENQDVVDHQLGPLWIPAGTEASLSLDQEENFIYTCTFNATNLFGLDVREPVTIWTRIGGTIFSGVPMAAILALYSLVMWPINEKEEVEDSAA